MSVRMKESSFAGGTSQGSFGKGFLVVTCLIAVVSLGIEGAPEAETQPDLAAKLAEIDSLRKSSGIENAEWTKRLIKKAEIQQEPEICYEEGCLDASLELLNAINSSFDPCDNFFQFACGKWVTNNPVPSLASKWNRFNGLRIEADKIIHTILNEAIDNEDAKPVNQVKEYYKECINLDKLEAAGVAPILRLLEEFGGWPLMNPAIWNESEFDWIKSVAELRRRLYDPAIISAFPERDLGNSSRMSVWFAHPFFGLPRSIVANPGSFPTLIAAYRTLIVELAQGLGSTEPTADLEAAADAIIELDSKLANIASDDNPYDTQITYHPFKLSDFQGVTDSIDSTFSIGWKSFLDQFFSSSGVIISDDEQLNVAALPYFLKLSSVLKETPPKVIADYIGFRAVKAVASGTTEAMRAILFKFSQAQGGAPEPPTRESTCANSLNNYIHLGMALGVKYIERAFDDEAKGVIDELVSNLIASFRELLDEVDWMEDSAKTEAVAKLGNISTFMGFPEWLKNKTALEEYCTGLELATGPEAHFQSVLNLLVWTSDEANSKLRVPTSQDEWLNFPVAVNAYYARVHNFLVFPAGHLQPPFFGKLRPASQNYGGIGAIIAHEMSHGFDNQGSQYDRNGNANTWWDPVTLEKFNEKAECMVDQYSKFYLPNIDMHVNGQLTRAENIGDNGGLRDSFRAYRKHVEDLGKEEGRLPGLEQLTPNQLFFLGYANVWCESITDDGLRGQITSDTHSPAEFRVIGPLKNSKDFAEAYACPVNADGMNPPEAEKCTVW